MYILIMALHVLCCVFLVLVVLLQTGKGADMGAVFGGSSSTVFGSSGAGNFLTRLTTAMAVIFMLTSLSLTYLSGRQTTSTVFDAAPLSESAPAAAPLGSAPSAETGEAAPVLEQPQGEPAPPAGAEAPSEETAPEARAEQAGQ
jgi:preprotein translocase subunit SecG